MASSGADTQTGSTSSFISALVLGLVVVGALTTAFLVLFNKSKFRTVYESRRYLAPPSKRPPVLPPGVFGFWKTILKTQDVEIIRANGVDAYLFLRFIKVFGLFMLVPYFLLTFIILIPVSASSNGGLTGLNQLTFGNVGTNQQNRHIAHFLVAIILMFWTIYLIYHEYQHFEQVRKQWLADDLHQSSASSRTVMLVHVPESMMSQEGLHELASTHVAPSSIGKVWLSRNVKDLEKVWEDRNKECARLEAGEGKLLALATKNVKKGKTPVPVTGPGNSPVENGPESIDLENHGSKGSDALIERFVLPKKKPTWKQGFLGLFGTKMDLKSSPEFIKEKNEDIEARRAKLDELERGNVAFIRFNTQHDAHVFARVVSSGKATKKVFTGIEIYPEDVEWSNTSMAPNMRKSRTLISWALFIGLLLIWAPLIAFVGIISNVDALCAQASWMRWLCNLPSPVEGIIKGVLPPVALAVVFMLLPPFLRAIVKFAGVARLSDIELTVWSRYWVFQWLEGFLIICFSSGLIAALSDLGNTASSVPTLLATKLPSSSIFFLTYILASTFSSAAKSYSRIVPVVMFLLLPILGGKIPRKFWASHNKMISFPMATTWPPISLLICITIVYSVIQPVITLVGLVAFALTYMSNKYLLGWCADQPEHLETGGLYYPKALKGVFLSLYLEEICLAGLLFLSTDENGKRAKSGIAGGVLMAIMIAITAVAQFWMQHYKFIDVSYLYANGTLQGGNAPEHKLALAATNDGEAGEQYGITTGLHEHAFDHPSTWKAQPIIWMADDSLKIAEAETKRLNDIGVTASHEYASMDTEGKLHVERCAPDESWVAFAE